MIEAQIICCKQCDIPDLGIEGLKPGEERWVTTLTADSSTDLKKEQAKGNVRVYRKVRRHGAAPRRPVPPFVAASRPRVLERSEPDNPTSPAASPPPAPPSIDVEELARQMKNELIEDLIPDLQEAIAQEVGKALKQHSQKEAPEEQSVMADSRLENLLEGVLRRVGVPVAGPRSEETSSSVVPDEPVFIPSSIVDKDAKGKITVKSKKSEGADDLESAQAALREMKRAARGRKKGNEEK